MLNKKAATYTILKFPVLILLLLLVAGLLLVNVVYAAVTVEVPVFNVTTITETTGVKANTTYANSVPNNGTLYFRWFRNGSEVYSDNQTGIENNTIVNSTLSNTLYIKGDTVNVSVYANDSTVVSTVRSAQTIVGNTLPTQGKPILNSTLGTNKSTENLTVYNVSTFDADSDAVKNIYNWVLNNISIAEVNMPFEGGSNTTYTKDYSGFGNDGVVSNAVWNSTGGVDGKGAYEFDGKNAKFIETTNISVGNFTVNFTLLMWVKPKGNSDSTTPRIIDRGGTSAAGGYHIFYSNITQRTQFQLTAFSGIRTSVPATNSIPFNAWTCLGATYNGTTMATYINGTKSASTNYTTYEHANITNTINVHIGAVNYETNHFFNGTIDDVMLINKLLSQEQISAFCQQTRDTIVSQTTNVGEIWNASITPNDGGIGDGATLFSSALTINAIPTVEVPVFNVTTITETSGVKANTTYADEDADAGTLYFRWFRNGTEVYTDNQTSISTGTIVNSTLSNTLYIRGDTINVSVYAFDSRANSAVQNSTQLTVANTAPTVEVPVFNVTTVTETSGVKVNTTYADADADAGTLYFRWFRNGSEVFTNNQSTIASGTIVNSTLSNTFYNGGDIINVTVYANDDTDNSAVQESAQRTVAHISITVDIPVFNVTTITETSGVKANTTYKEGEGILGKVYFRWFRNGSEVYSDNQSSIGNNTIVNSTLSNTLYIKGDTINVSVYANDGIVNSVVQESEQEIVANTAPTVAVPVFNVTTVTETSGIKANTTYNDIDIDGGTLYFRWFRNGSEVYTDNQSTIASGTIVNSTLSNTLYIKGDTLNVSVYANDGTANSAVQNSSQLIVANTVPTHGTPILNSTLGTNKSTENLTIYNTSTADADADSVKNIYNWFLNNISIATVNMPFEGGSNSTYTKDYSGFGNDAVVSNAVWNATAGVDGKGAYEFDKTNNKFIETTNVSVGNFTVNFTILMWVKPTGNSDSTTPRIIDRGGTSAAGGYHIFWSNVSQTTQFQLTAFSGIRSSTPPVNSVPVGAWSCLGTTYNGTTMSTYVNGTLSKATSYSTYEHANVTNTINVHIGAVNYETAHFFNGTIDDVMLINKLLTQEQITAFCQQTRDTIVSQTTIVGETWNASITPNDGASDGTTLGSTALTILNTAPTVDAPVFNVTTVTETSGVKANTTYADADVNAGTLYFRWFRNGSEVYTDNQSTIASGTIVNSTLSNTLYIKGDTLNVSVYANDGTANSAVENSTQLTVANTAPTVDAPVFNVTTVTETSGIKANTTYNDIDIDGGTLYFRWFRNGSEVYTDNQSTIASGTIVNSTLSNTLYIKGDTLNVSVYASDGTANSAVQNSSQLTVANTAPTVDAPVFNVTTVTETSGIKANTTYNDVDIDGGTLYFRWFRNGSEVYTDNQSTIASGTIVNSTLSNTLYIKGDTINMSVYASDGTANSAVQNSTQLIVANTPPTVAVPLFNVTTVTETSGVKANTTYNDIDIDGGTIYFRWFRNGSLVYADTQSTIASGTILNSTLSNTLYIRGDVLNVTVYAHDGEDTSPLQESEQKTVANSVPLMGAIGFNVSTITETSGVGAETVYYDGDLDVATLYFRWFRNGTEVYTDNQTSITHGTLVNSALSNTFYIKGDTINVTVYANDGTANSNVQESEQKIVANTLPTQGTPILNSTYGYNNSDENLLAYNISTYDADNDVITNEYQWYRNNVAYSNTSSSTMASANILGGEVWRVEVVPSDGSAGAIAVSNNLTVYYLNITLSTPENNSHQNTVNQAFTFTPTAAGISICSLWDNDTGVYGNSSSISTIVQNSANTITHTGIAEAALVWNIECKSPAGTFFSATSNFSLVIDRSLPSITFYKPATTNATVYTGRSVQLNVSCTDGSGLYEFQVNITNSTNQTIYGNLTTNITGTVFNFIPLINFADNATGYYSMETQCSDDHTEKQIPEYIVKIGKTGLSKTQADLEDLDYKITEDSLDSLAEEGAPVNAITFDTGAANISVQAVSSLLNLRGIEAEQAVDRYRFIYIWEPDALVEAPYTMIYHVSSSEPITYRNNSAYSGHFVSGQSWIDFMGVNGTVTAYQNDTGWYVRIITSETIHNFSSIGGLNIVEQNLTFFYDGSFDIANTTNITHIPDTLRRGDVVSFNATFNLTGSTNATGINVTLTIDNEYITSTVFNLATGATREIELNWTAVPGIHDVRLNADANNTYGERFEDNNNASITSTIYNISNLNLSLPITGAEIIRGRDTSALPGEDTLKKVSNFTTVLARVYNKHVPSVGVNSNCTFYFNNTIFLGWNQTNTTGECSFTFDHTIYATGIYNITVNFTNLNITDYAVDRNISLIHNQTTVDLSKVEVDLDVDNLRAGIYNPGDVAVINITITKNNTAYDPNQFIVEVKNPGAECAVAGGILYNMTYPGADVVGLGTGLYQAYSVLQDTTDVHWCIIVNNSIAEPLASASHSDREVLDVAETRANFSVVNTSDSGDNSVFDDVNASIKTLNGYRLLDRNFTENDYANILITVGDAYNVLFKHYQRQESLNISRVTISSAGRSLPFELLATNNGAYPVGFTNVTSIIAFNDSGFVFNNAKIVLQNQGLAINKIVHCLNWNFSSGKCIGLWEINGTLDYQGFGQNATHLWFNVSDFSAYSGGNGTNSQLFIYDSAEASYAEAGYAINFSANYTRVADNVSITGGECSISLNGTYGMTYFSEREVYNYTTTLLPANYTWTVSCSKGSSFDNRNATDTIDVRDTIPPAVGSITPTEVYSDADIVYSATVTDADGVASCYLFINGVNMGVMAYNGTTATRSEHIALDAIRTYEMYANCTDNGGNNAYTPTNVSFIPPSGDGEPSTSRAPSSTGGTATGLEEGKRYLSLKEGNTIYFPVGDEIKYVKIMTIFSNSVELDVNGEYIVILLTGLLKRFDLNYNGVDETTIYVDNVVAYSKTDITILVKDDGDAGEQAVSFFDLGSIWSKIIRGEAEETDTEREDNAAHIEPVAESPQSISINGIQIYGSAFINALAGLVHSLFDNSLSLLVQLFESMIHMQGSLIVALTLLIVVPTAIGGFMFRRITARKALQLTEELKKEMRYKGLK